MAIRMAGLPTARGLDVVFHPNGHHLSARQAYEYGRGRQADGDHGILQRRSEEGRQTYGKDHAAARATLSADDARPGMLKRAPNALLDYKAAGIRPLGTTWAAVLRRLPEL
jgi:hypothetical protein